MFRQNGACGGPAAILFKNEQAEYHNAEASENPSWKALPWGKSFHIDGLIMSKCHSPYLVATNTESCSNAKATL
jgi:hypothetical protein